MATRKTYDENPFDNPSPSVDKDANMSDKGDLKETVEEVKEDSAPTEQAPKEAQITPDAEVETREELTPDAIRAQRTIGTS